MEEGKKPVVAGWDDEIPSTESKPVTAGWDDVVEPVKKKEPTTLEVGGTSTSALGGGKSDLSIPGVQNWKDRLQNKPQAIEPEIKMPVPPTKQQVVSSKPPRLSEEGVPYVPPSPDVFKSVAFNKEKARINALENPEKVRFLSKTERYEQAKLLDTRQAVLGKLAFEKSKEIEGLEKELNSIDGNIEPERYNETLKLYQRKVSDLKGYGARMDSTKNELIALSEGQDAITNSWDALNSGLNSLTAGILRTPQFVYNTMINAQNGLAKMTGLPIEANYQTDGYLSNLAKEFDKNAEEYKRVIEKKHSANNNSIVEYFEKGDISGGIGLMFEQIMESAPITAGFAISSLAGPGAAATIVGGGAVFGAEKYEELQKENPKMSENAKFANAWATGLVEGIFEETGTVALLKHGKKILAKGGREALEKEAKNIFQKTYAAAAKKLLPVTTTLGEGLSEAETAFSQNVIAKVTGEDPDRKVTEGVADAFLVGAGQGALMGIGMASKSAPVDNGIAELIKKYQKSLDQINKDLQNPNLPEATKVVLNTIATGLKNKIDQANRQDDELTENLSLDDYNKVVSYRNEVEEMKASLNEVSSPELKEAVLLKIGEVESKINEIIAPTKEVSEKEPILQKFTSPTDEAYGTVNRNDGKGLVTLTKEEFLKESGASGISKGMEEVPAVEVGGVGVVTEGGEQVTGGEVVPAVGEEVVAEKEGVDAEKRAEEIRKRGLDRLFPIEIDETTAEGKELAKQKFEQSEKIKELDAELAAIESGKKPETVEQKEDWSKDVESTAKALDEKKKSLDEKAKKLGYVGIKQFNAQNQLNEKLSNEEKELLQEYSGFQQEVKNLKDENVISKLSDDEFSSWSKANDITRDDLGKVVKDEEIELAAKRIRILNARGDSKKADSELKKLKESKKKDNWTVESWKERFDEDIEQFEIDDINQSNKEFNNSLDKAVEELLGKPSPEGLKEEIEEKIKPKEDAKRNESPQVRGEGEQVEAERSGDSNMPKLNEAGLPVGETTKEEVEPAKPEAEKEGKDKTQTDEKGNQKTEGRQEGLLTEAKGEKLPGKESEPVSPAPLKGKEVEIKFSDRKSKKGKFKLIEADDLIPSHTQSGQRNPKHTIAEAQPKERSDKGSKFAQESISNNPKLSEVGTSPNAYSGAPVVNQRGEVIQGNNRSIGLKGHYQQGKTSYKEQLAERAEEFGLTKEQVMGMKNPILVREVEVSKEEAIELGNYDVKDIETGGKQRIDPLVLSRKMSSADKAKLADIIFGSDAATTKQGIRENIKAVTEILKKYLNSAQLQTAFDNSGEPTVAGMNDIEALLNNFIFSGGSVNLPEFYEGIKDIVRKGIEKGLKSILSVPSGKEILPDIQAAIIGYYDFLLSGESDFNTWANQMDAFKGGSPKSIFNAFELYLIEKFHNAKTQKEIAQIFDKYLKLSEGVPADMFNDKVEGLTKKEAIYEITGNEYVETEPERLGENGNKEDGREAEEAEQSRAIAEAEERRQLNTPRNAIDVAKIFRKDFGFTPWESAIAARMFDAKAMLFSRVLGISKEEYYQRYWLTGTSQEGLEHETRKGSWSKEAKYAKRIIAMYEKANSTTAIHEILGHDYLDNIIQAAELGDKQSIEDLNTIVEEYIKEEKPKLSKAQVLKIVKEFNVETNNTDAGRKVHEWFAKAAERYFASGDNLKPEVANTKLGRLFEKFRQHVANLYTATTKELIPPSPAMKKVFRRLFGEENFEILDINDKVIQQAKEDNERVPATEKANKLVSKLPTKIRKGLSQDEMTPEEILLEAAKDLIQNNESDKYNIVNDLKALVYKETGNKDYWPDIDDLKEKLEEIDKPDEGKIFNATVERALADKNISPEIKKKLRSKEIRERDTYSLLKQISDSIGVVDMVGPETIANLLLEQEKSGTQFNDYEFVTLASIAAKRLNAMKKLATTAARKAELTQLTTELYDVVSQKGSGISRALNSYRAWNLLDADGMAMVIRKKMNQSNGNDPETAKERAKRMQKEFEQLKKDFDWAFTGMLDSEEVRGRLEEEIAELNKKIADYEKRKGQRTKTDTKTGKPITKGREFNPKFEISEVKNFFKDKFKPGLSQDEVTEEDFKEAVADLLSKQKSYSFSSFIKAFNSQMGEKYTARDLKELYETTVDYMTDNGYEGGFSDAAEIGEVITDEAIEAEAAADVVKRDLLVKHEKEMKAYMEKQRKAFIDDVAAKMNTRGLWEQYINSVTGELVGKVAQNLGQGGTANKALLDEFTNLVKNAIKEKLDEVLPVSKGQPTSKTAKQLAENIADLAKNEEKFAEVFDAMVEKLQEKYKGDINSIAALQALANIQNPFSAKLLSKAVSKQFEGTGWKLGDVAFGRGTGLMASQMAQQVLSDGGLLGTPAEAVLRPMLEDAFKLNAKKFEDSQLESLANYIVNDAKKAVGAVSPVNKTFVDEMIGALKRKVREQYKANNKAAPADPLDLIKFALKETGKADQVGGSLWSQAQAEVIAKINADTNLTPSQKQDAINFLKDFTNSVFDTIVPVSTLERAIVREIKKSGIALNSNGGIPWEELIKGVDGQIDQLRQIVEDAIRVELGNNYNPVLVDVMVNRIVDQYDSMIAEKKKAFFEKQLASFSSAVSIPFVKDRRIGGMVGKLMAMDKSGLLDAQAYNDLISDYMGIARLTPQEWNELQYLLRQIEESPEGFERVTAIENVTLFLESKQPMYGANVMRAIYYANLLSGFSTAIKNLTGIFDVMFMALSRSVTEMDTEYLKKFKAGLSQGDFGDIIRRGSANQGDKVDIPTDSMGLAHVNTLERWRRYPGLRNKVFGSLAYVSRVLNATDAAVQRSVQEQTDYYLTKKDLKFKNPTLTKKAIKSMAVQNMFRDDILFEDAVSLAVNEMNARGMNVNKADVLAELLKPAYKQSEDTVRARRRAYEIMKANRLAEIKLYSGKDALKNAFKTEYKDNRGLITGIGSLLIAGFNKIGMGLGEIGEFVANKTNASEAKKKAIKESAQTIPQTLIMPIIRGVANVAEVSAEKLLFYGPLKGAAKWYNAVSNNNKNFKAINKAMTTQERIEFEYKVMQAKDMIATSIAANLFVAAVTTLLMEAIPDDDEELKNGFYAAGTRFNVAKTGEKAKMVVIPENSIVIGGKIFSFSWFGTMALSLSAWANYQGEKNKEDFDYVDFVLGTFSGMLSASMFEPISRISDVISPKFKDGKTYGDRAMDWASNIGKSAIVNTFIPWSNMQAQMYQGGQMMFGEGMAQDAIGIDEKIVKSAPILRLALAPLSNYIPAVGYDRPSLDYAGDPIPLEVKNPGSASSLFQLFQDRKIPEFKVYDTKIGLNIPFNGKTIENSLTKETMSDEEYYDYKKDVSVAFGAFQKKNYNYLSDYESTIPTNSEGAITLRTQEQQKAIALNMFGMPYNILSPKKVAEVNQGINYREASEKVHSAIERYFNKVYLNKLGISQDIDLAREDLENEVYMALPTSIKKDDRDDIAITVLANSPK